MRTTITFILGSMLLIGLIAGCTVSAPGGSAPAARQAPAASPTTPSGASSAGKATPATPSTPVALSTANAFGRNLIFNGDAEAGPGAANDSDTVPAPSWIVVSGKFTAIQYGAEGGFAEATDPGPQARGRNYFVGGPDAEESSATQKIDLSAIAAQIDGGKLQFKFEGYLGGYEGQGDSVVVTLAWTNSSGGSLGGTKLGPVTPDDRSNQTGPWSRTATGAVPSGTRSAIITMQFTRTDGSYNDGSVDNLSLVLTQT